MQILSHWLPHPRQLRATPLHSGRGFSGAAHWKVEQGGRKFVLRRWAYDYTSDRLKPIHALQAHLAAAGSPVPAPLPSLNGQTVIESQRCCWELAPWMPGAADYHIDPRPSKLAAALQSLARLHLAASSISPAIRPSENYISPAWQNRSERLHQLEHGGLAELQQVVQRLPAGTEKDQAEETISLAVKLTPIELERCAKLRELRLPSQWCLRDIWHDHVLFTDDRVTGIIDFGAASLDSPSVDIVRLLGSMVGDDEARWRLGLAAYEWIRPLPAAEREAIPYLDSSAVLLAPVNWVRWLYASTSVLPLTIDRPTALKRLERLLGRLRNLAAQSGI